MISKEQICATVPKELIALIKAEAERDDRTFSQMVAILLQQAIKEKTRKRANKENNP